MPVGNTVLTSVLPSADSTGYRYIIWWDLCLISSKLVSQVGLWLKGKTQVSRSHTAIIFGMFLKLSVSKRNKKVIGDFGRG